MSKDIADYDTNSNAINQLDLIDIYRPLYSTTASYTFFSASQRTLNKIDYILGHKRSLNKFKRNGHIKYAI